MSEPIKNRYEFVILFDVEEDGGEDQEDAEHDAQDAKNQYAPKNGEGGDTT